MNRDNSRIDEWFVPKFGPIKIPCLGWILILTLYSNVCMLHSTWGFVISCYSYRQIVCFSSNLFPSIGISCLMQQTGLDPKKSDRGQIIFLNAN